MTVALGILAGNSQIIAADTQHSTDTETLGQGKISFRVQPESGSRSRGVIAITGAGDTFNLEALQSDLSDVFATFERIDSMDEIEKALARRLRSFYRDHIALTPHAAERPEVELIIAARHGVFSQTWVTKRNKISKAKSPFAVGIGGMYAADLLGRMSLPQQPETAMLVAAYVVFLVKERNLWVGKDTQVICLDDSIFPKMGFSGPVCRRLEEIFRSYMGVEARAFHRFLGSKYDFCEAERLQKEMETMRERLDEFLHPKSPTTSDSMPAS